MAVSCGISLGAHLSESYTEVLSNSVGYQEENMAFVTFSGLSKPGELSPEKMFLPVKQEGRTALQNTVYGPVQGTVVPYPNFDANQDAQVLRKAMKGLGTDEKAIIEVLAHRSNSQRQYISVAFKTLFGKDLIDDLKNELSGNFEQVILALMTPLNDYLAKQVHKAISGIGTDEATLIEILCTRTNREIWDINEAYRRSRDDGPPDPARAKQSAHQLYAAGVGQWGTDESVFNSILAAQSYQQLGMVFYEYHQLAGHSVATAIEKEFSGDVGKGMLAIARCVENRPAYFAEKLYKSMKGLGTDDDTLIRIVVTRSEIDMVQIKAEYQRMYGKPLAKAISGDTSGDYKKVLIALVGGSG